MANPFLVCMPPPPPRDYHTFHEVSLELGENCGSSRLLKFIAQEILQDDPNDTCKYSSHEGIQNHT